MLSALLVLPERRSERKYERSVKIKMSKYKRNIGRHVSKSAKQLGNSPNWLALVLGGPGFGRLVADRPLNGYTFLSMARGISVASVSPQKEETPVAAARRAIPQNPWYIKNTSSPIIAYAEFQLSQRSVTKVAGS